MKIRDNRENNDQIANQADDKNDEIKSDEGGRHGRVVSLDEGRQIGYYFFLTFTRNGVVFYARVEGLI